MGRGAWRREGGEIGAVDLCGRNVGIIMTGMCCLIMREVDLELLHC